MRLERDLHAVVGGELRGVASSTGSPSSPTASRAPRETPAATGVVTQFGCFASSESPGQPENVTTTGTSSCSASRTVFRNTSSSALRGRRDRDAAGCRGTTAR